jgi:hypothetical protein
MGRGPWWWPRGSWLMYLFFLLLFHLFMI